VDGTSLFLANSFDVKIIKPVPSVSTEVHSFIPGNAPKQYNSNSNDCTQEQNCCNLIQLDGNNSNIQSIFAFPLTKEDQETGKVIESPPIKLPSKKCLTPTSIAVVGTISSVMQILLKVLFDPGSTSTLISCKCLIRQCKPCALTNESKIHMLAGFCSTK
jgi:hypothetical protein